MKKVMVILVVLILGILVMPIGMVYAVSNDEGQAQVYIPPYTYMSPDSIYYVFSQKGEILNIGLDLRSIPLEHIAYYLPLNSRCVIYEYGHLPIVIYAIGEGGHILPPPLPVEPCLY